MSEDAAVTPLRIDVRSGAPAPEEVAAVIAVVTEAYERESANTIADDAPRRSAWEVSARGLRGPWQPTGWGGFRG